MFESRRRSLNDKERNQPATQRGERGQGVLLKSNTIRGQNPADPIFSPDSDLLRGAEAAGREMKSRGAARRSRGEDDHPLSRVGASPRKKKFENFSLLCFYFYFYFYIFFLNFFFVYLK